jgi:hypothetical protein
MLFGVGIPYYSWVNVGSPDWVGRRLTEFNKLTDWYSWMERKRL